MIDWSALADELGLELLQLSLEDGVRIGYLAERGLDPDQAESLPPAQRKELGHALKAVSMLAGLAGMALGGLSLAKANLLRGEYQGLRAHVFQRRGEHPSIGISLRFAAPVGCGLRIVREGLHHKLGKLLRLTQDLQLADPELDPLVLIQAEDESRARDWLANEALRAELLQLFQLSAGVEVLDWGLRYDEPGETINAGRARAILDAMANVAASAGQ